MLKNRKGTVFYNQELAGYISETEEGYRFIYDNEFIKNKKPISLSLPLQSAPFISTELFPFFKGLLPEGWYLDIVAVTQKVDKNDLFGLLLNTTGKDTIGAVTVQKAE